MIDIHSHILPGLDDGSPDLEESVAMIRMAADAGTADIVASPHSDLQFSFDPAITERKIAELAQACDHLIHIHYGCDFHLYYENIQDALAHPAKYAINHKCYVLVEFSELLVLRTADEMLARMASAGIRPIITHPERNAVLQHNVQKLECWVREGCTLQVTGQSLLGRFGRTAQAFSEDLLKRNLVHFVASDGHDCRSRPPRLDDSREWVRREFGEAAAERLFVQNPRLVLSGEPLPDAEPVTETVERKWWRLWQ